MAQRKKRASVRPDFVEYYVQIDGWETQVGLSAVPSSFKPGPYGDFYFIQFWGRFLAPDHIRGASVLVSLKPDYGISQSLREPSWNCQPASCVGSIQALKKGQYPQILLDAPADWMPCVLTLLSIDRIRFIGMGGSPLLRGYALLKRWNFIRALNPDDNYEVVDLPPQEGGPHAHVHEEFVPRARKRSRKALGG